ncbi:30290_t:CDS:2 [Racocetra persica]|uniref:30290_t:CDS:1 n=1 Tax=Racocetra persica TaxID=160502 RepID=A0ACA9KAD4_9GLOM|nr:30290_t:CDS:2 [Racocetra persica]
MKTESRQALVNDLNALIQNLEPNSKEANKVCHSSCVCTVFFMINEFLYNFFHET